MTIKINLRADIAYVFAKHLEISCISRNEYAA